MDVKDIVKKYLEENGFHGLYEPDNECACESRDLFPCGENPQYCIAGYKVPCDCGDHDFHISAEKDDKVHLQIGADLKTTYCNLRGSARIPIKSTSNPKEANCEICLTKWDAHCYEIRKNL